MNSLIKAAKLIDKQIGRVQQYSPVVESEPWGFDAETTFYNQVIQVETEFNPQHVLKQILEIEKNLGRIRSVKAYTSRTIDIDILSYNQEQVKEYNLVIPHPLMHMRKFVLFPLSLIAPGFVHPVLKIPVSVLLSQLEDQSPIRVVAGTEEFTRLLIQ